jgi:hypothetical protein
MKPTVTQLISLLDKPALLKWANKIGLQGINIDDYRKESFSKGNLYHSQIENYIKYNIPFIDQSFFNRFKYFMEDKEIIESEKNIENEYYRGRYDIKLKYNDSIYICDFKTNQKNIYFENKLQLSAYKFADSCDKLAVISIPDFSIFEINIEEYQINKNILVNLHSIYNLKNQLNQNGK